MDEETARNLVHATEGWTHYVLGVGESWPSALKLPERLGSTVLLIELLCSSMVPAHACARLPSLAAPVRPQWAAKLANEKKGRQRLGILPTRVSGSGKVYLRLPVSFDSQWLPIHSSLSDPNNS